MSLRLNGSTSGYTEIDAPAVAGSNTLVLPTGNGSSGQFLQTNGSGTLSFASAVVNGSSSAIVSGTAVASTSGTSIDFTGIPSWVKRVTVMFSGVSTNGTSLPQIQLGDSGGVETTGYTAGSSVVAPSSIATTNYTTGFVIRTDALAAIVMDGFITVNLISSSTNTWAAGGTIYAPTPSAYLALVAGRKSLSATLDRVRITTVNGTDTFDAGSINILYE
jgi:hypothetical protein